MTDSSPAFPLGPDFLERLARMETDVDERQLAVRAAADALRSAIDELLTTAADIDAIRSSTQLVSQASDLLAAREHGRTYATASEASLAGSDLGSREFLEYSPLFGPANPIAPPLTLTITEESVVAHATFGDVYEGPPGCVHGGFIAAAFDEVLGMTLSWVGMPGMTGRLTIHYRSPTPLHTKLRFEGRLDRRDGRKLLTSATLHAGDRLCAEAEGLFVLVDEAMFERLRQQRDASSQDRPG